MHKHAETISFTARCQEKKSVYQPVDGQVHLLPEAIPSSYHEGSNCSLYKIRGAELVSENRYCPVAGDSRVFDVDNFTW
jgi:hypothetical protein